MIENHRKRKIIRLVFVVFGVLLIISFGVITFINYQMSLIPKMSYMDMINYTTKDQKDIQLAVGIMQDGVIEVFVYGENGALISNEGTTYEIGSLTKTFTAALLCKASYENDVDLDGSISMWLDLPNENHYPTIKQILTHTSGYRNFYFETPMISNYFNEDNDFYGIDKRKVLERIRRTTLTDKHYDFKYSNFGMAVGGLVIEEVYNQTYEEVLEHYIKNDLNLKNTYLNLTKSADNDYWSWKSTDAYVPAGALLSTIDDMIRYADLQLQDESYLLGCHQKVYDVQDQSSRHLKMGIRVDGVGIGWMIDEVDDIIWHNGATTNYNSYLGFHKDSQTAVVVLSNLGPNKRIPATVIGIRLLKDLLHD
jgi:CubicO group peptidase (beta-lactamase class C family)